MTKRRQKMAQRYCKRAKIQEAGVTISFGFKNLIMALLLDALEAASAAFAPLRFGVLLLSLVFFPFHRTVLVTEQHAYVYRDLPFHRPGEMLAMYPLGADVVTRKRGKLTFADGHVVWHSPFFAWRVRQVEEAIRAGQTTQNMATA